MNKNFTNLYVIGNGFDRFHGLKTSYNDFHEYLKAKKPNLLKKLALYYNTQHEDCEDYLWADFERSLEYFDKDTLEQITDSMPYAGTDNYIDQSYDIAEPIVQELLRDVKKEIRNSFEQWITDINVTGMKKVQFLDNSLFLSFNYTKTLQQIYNITSKRILHIHGSANNNGSIIFGHGGMLSEYTSERINNDNFNIPENKNPRYVGVKNDVDRFISEFYKNTKEISENYSYFFQNLINIENICIFGHSLSNIDWEYFKRIVDMIDIKKVKWYISYFSNETYENKDNMDGREYEILIDKFEEKFKIPPNNIIYFNTVNYDEWEFLIKNKILIPVD